MNPIELHLDFAKMSWLRRLRLCWCVFFGLQFTLNATKSSE